MQLQPAPGMTWAAWGRSAAAPWHLLATGSSRMEVAAEVREYAGELRILPAEQLPVTSA
jgi:hypothetical protein